MYLKLYTSQAKAILLDKNIFASGGEGNIHKIIARDPVSQVAKIYLDGLKKKNIDTLILGCTHYPFLKNVIKKVMGNDINLVDPIDGIIEEMKNYISKNPSNSKNPSVTLYFSDINPYFKKVLTNLLKIKNYRLKHVNLEEKNV